MASLPLPTGLMYERYTNLPSDAAFPRAQPSLRSRKVIGYGTAIGRSFQASHPLLSQCGRYFAEVA